ncbi:hypothetical protein K2W90_06265 [Candidatus Babeliales bacterium]|nr:hypothetical protein [Candidatus Babeliales bacterium]
MKRRIYALGLFIAVLSVHKVQAFAPVNFFRSYDYALRFPYIKNRTASFGVFNAEYGARCTGLNNDDDRRNVLAIHNDTESAISMTRNPTSSVEMAMGAPLKGLYDTFDDVDLQGHQQLRGKFSGLDFTLFASYVLPLKAEDGMLAISAHLPIVWREIRAKKTLITDLTQVGPLTPQGANIKTYLTDDLVKNVKEFGGLNLATWDKSGIGDLDILLEWSNRYKQDKEYLKLVMLYAKLGLSFPTARERDQDQAFSMPLGNDGAWGIPLGIAMELGFVHNVRVGIDVDFLLLFDTKKEYRMKTDKNQTDFLLLNKGLATKEYGFTWQFHLFIQGLRIWEGLSVKGAYQFVKHDDDRLIPHNNVFDFSVVNTANNLKEWNVHNLIFTANYDFFHDCKDCAVNSQLSFFYKLPVDGKNIIDNHSVGGQFSLLF